MARSASKGVRAYFRNEPRELARLRETVEEFVAEANLDALTGHHVMLILEELFTNVVKYSGGTSPAGAAAKGIMVGLDRKGSSIRIAFADDGAPFNPLAVPEPELDEEVEERPIGGLGIHLVRSLTARASYQRAEGWNRLQLVCLTDD